MNGPLPQARDITRWAEAWRDGGGSLEITHLTMGWGPLGLTSSATLALDDQLQPMGSGNARIVGYAETLDRLAAARDADEIGCDGGQGGAVADGRNQRHG